MSSHIAIDLGAESGRVILGRIAEGRLELTVVHRFPTHNRRDMAGSLRWDARRLFDEIRRGLALAAAIEPQVDSIGVDTWGVDYALLDDQDQLIEDPYHYRDGRTEGIADAVRSFIPDADLFARSGVASLPFNTLFQLRAHAQQDPAALRRARTLLFMPDLLHFWLCGRKVCEWTIAGTSQMLCAGSRSWDHDLLNGLGIPSGFLPEVVPAGTPLDRLQPDLAAEVGFTTAPWVVAPAGHDTASAVAASPGDPATTAYLSSGTWSLAGVVADLPALSLEAQRGGLSNEIAATGQPRINRNIMGLWLIQQCRAGYAERGQDLTYEAMALLAAEAAPASVVLDVDDPLFLPPGSGDLAMDRRIDHWYRQRGHRPPSSVGATLRAILEGLAAAYRRAIEGIDSAAGRRSMAVHIIGGGSQHRLLCQLTADALARPVHAGPVEATAIGNIVVQARGLGFLDGAAARGLIAATSDTKVFLPALLARAGVTSSAPGSRAVPHR